MKFLPIFFLFLLVSCQNQPCSSDKNSSLDKDKPLEATAESCPTVPDDQPNDLPVEEVGDVPNEAFMFDAALTLTNFEVSDEEKVGKAIEIIKKVIQSQEFKIKVFSHTYQGVRKFHDTKLTNEQVYAKLLAGMEDLKKEEDHEMDLDLQLYYSSKNTVGYTYPSGLRIWMNTKYFDAYTPAQVAGNVFHEWTHKLGFEHAFKYSSSRDYSVPYALGKLMRELGKKYE